MIYNTLNDIELACNIELDSSHNIYNDIIISIFNNNYDIDNIDQTNPILTNIVGVYYGKNNNHIKMVEYYSIGVKLNYLLSINNLGNYYNNLGNFTEMKKYYLISIKLGDTNIMEKLGLYYKNVEVNYKEMKFYYMMAIKYGNVSTLVKLGQYYRDIEKNYDEMLICFTKAVKFGNQDAMNNLGLYYKNIMKDYNQMKIYYMMAISLNNPASMVNLANYYDINNDNENTIKYLLQAIELNYVPAMNKLCKIVTNNVNLYLLLSDSKIESELLYNKLTECKPDYKNYLIKNKINLNTSLPPIITFMDELYELYIQHNIKCEDGYITDFIINIEYDNVITEHYIHSFVLNCEYFKILINGNFIKQKEINIKVNHIQTGKDFICYLYTNKFMHNTNYNDLDYNRIYSLFILADSFGMEQLAQHCHKLQNIV